MDNKIFQDHVEWEVLYPEEIITNLTFEKGVYNINKDCIIRFTRDNKYDLIASISGILNDSESIDPNYKEGAFVSGDIIIGYSQNGLFKYIFSGALLGKNKRSLIAPNSTSVKFEAELRVDGVSRIFNDSDLETEYLHEWYLSGGTDNMFFPRITSRSIHESYKREREGIDPKDEFGLIKSSSSSGDYLFVKYADTSFIVSKVPKEFGSDWSFSLCIEYRASFGRIPDNNERIAISELVGFLMGNQLLKIGETTFDKSHSLIVQKYIDPIGDNIETRCQRISFPPVLIKGHQNRQNLEILIGNFLPLYLKQREALQLKNVLGKYWFSKYSAIGVNLPILSSAIETLANCILKANKQIKHSYIDYNEFVKLIEGDLASIKMKLGDNIFSDKIINKIKGVSQRGSNEKLAMVFEFLNLSVGKIENEAIKQRNKMAHSSLDEETDEEIHEIVRLSRAFETLFNRMLLRVLSYDGLCIDYYTPGHPQRNIKEAIPEINIPTQQ
ncbi:MAG TPA: hypothetical protein VK718_06125 [Ferruginibacter sp.]|jgi:hypothetical protein|nr:hypothetical protein [Ferruginibacter sp.]